MSYDEALAGRIRKLLGTRTDVVEKKMFGGLCFMVHGAMCCGLTKTDFMVRVGPARYDEALAEPHARPMDFTGKAARWEWCTWRLRASAPPPCSVEALGGARRELRLVFARERQPYGRQGSHLHPGDFGIADAVLVMRLPRPDRTRRGRNRIPAGRRNCVAPISRRETAHLRAVRPGHGPCSTRAR